MRQMNLVFDNQGFIDDGIRAGEYVYLNYLVVVEFKLS